MQDTSAERWAPIPGHDGYEVSDLGRVRSLDRVIIRRDGKPQPCRGQMLRTWPERDYLMVRLGSGRQWAVHRLVLEAFVGPCPEGMEGCHKNGNPSDPRLANLRWDTKPENMEDKLRHGRNHFAAQRTCKRRHPLFPPNLVPANLAQGNRACWACAKARRKIQWCKRNGHVPPDLQEESDRQYKAILAGRLDGRAGRKITKWRSIEQGKSQAS